MSAERIVAVLGRRDEPTDGVSDYCEFLARALPSYGYELETYRVPWAERGWSSALGELSEKATEWHGCWAFLQFTALAWSRHGFPLRAPAVLNALSRNGVRTGVVFHEFDPFGGSDWVGRARCACQRSVLKRLYQNAQHAIFTVPLKNVSWIGSETARAAFIPVGANCPPCTAGNLSAANKTMTVGVYCVTIGRHMLTEVGDITCALKSASEAIGPLNVIVLGRGSREAEPKLLSELAGTRVDVKTLGVLTPEGISQTLAGVDVLLSVRGHISNRRGSAIVGVACSLPIVCYRGRDTCGPITEAGIFDVPYGDRIALAHALKTVLSDDALRKELAERSRRAQELYFSWPAIASHFVATLQGQNSLTTSTAR